MTLQKQYYYGKASSLLEAIERNIGFDEKSGLIKDGSSEGVFLDTFENSSLGIAYVLQGRDEQAQKILKGIEKYIGIDPKTGLFYNKKGLSEGESKKILPGEKTLYLSNQVLISALFWLLRDKEKSNELGEKFEREIGTFEFKADGKKYQIYRHGGDKDYFYPFNNLLVAIIKVVGNEKNEAEGLVSDIKEICFDNIGLLRANPKDRVYYILNNALLASYYAVTQRVDEAEKIISLLENKVGFDDITRLAYEGFTPRKKIKNILTYANSQLAITYLCLAGLFPKE